MAVQKTLDEALGNACDEAKKKESKSALREDDSVVLYNGQKGDLLVSIVGTHCRLELPP